MEPVRNQETKFQQNPTAHGWVIYGVNLGKFKCNNHHQIQRRQIRRPNVAA